MRTDQPDTYIPTDSLARGTRAAVGEFLVYRDLRTVDDTALYAGATSRFHRYSLFDASVQVEPLAAWRLLSEPDTLCFPPVDDAMVRDIQAVALIPLRDEQLRFQLSPNGFEVTWPAGLAWYLVPVSVLAAYPQGRGTSAQKLPLALLEQYAVYDEQPLTASRLAAAVGPSQMSQGDQAASGGESAPPRQRELTSPRSL